MRLVLDRRARRLLARLPRYNARSVAELALLTLLAWQCARLLLTIATPVGPVGDWRADTAVAPPASILSTFDPFFRLADTRGAVVTGLDLKLFGIRADQASGRGSAIVGLPSGGQTSVSVGEEIVPGVTLKAVAFDHVVILRGGAEEQMFLDQSRPATVVSPPVAGAVPEVAVNAPATVPFASVPAAALAGAASVMPRVGRDGIDGLIVQPAGDGSVLAAAGLQAGDVIVSVNGVAVREAEDAGRIRQQLGRGGDAALVVERGGAEIPLTVRIAP